MAKPGRKPKPGSKSAWIPGDLTSIVSAMKRGDVLAATVHFSQWVTAQNSREVNRSKKKRETNSPTVPTNEVKEENPVFEIAMGIYESMPAGGKK